MADEGWESSIKVPENRIEEISQNVEEKNRNTNKETWGLIQEVHLINVPEREQEFKKQSKQ